MSACVRRTGSEKLWASIRSSCEIILVIFCLAYHFFSSSVFLCQAESYSGTDFFQCGRFVLLCLSEIFKTIYSCVMFMIELRNIEFLTAIIKNFLIIVLNCLRKILFMGYVYDNLIEYFILVHNCEDLLYYFTCSRWF